MRLSVALLASLVGCATSGARPSTAVLPDSSFGALWYPDGFRAALETPLRSEADTVRTAFRVITLGTWGGAGIRRLERHQGTWWLIGKAIDETRPEPRLSRVDSARVSDEQMAELMRIVTVSSFWTKPRPVCRLGFDDYIVILEARVGRTYSALDCWSPREADAPAVVATMRAFDALYERVLGARR